MPLRIEPDNSTHSLRIDYYEGPIVNPRVLTSATVTLPPELTITKVIAPFFHPTNNCPDEGSVYLYAAPQKRWGLTTVRRRRAANGKKDEIVVDPIRWFPL